MTNTIKYSVDQDGIALLTIDLPDKSMNVLTPELMQDLETVVERVANDEAVKGAVIQESICCRRRHQGHGHRL